MEDAGRVSGIMTADSLAMLPKSKQPTFGEIHDAITAGAGAGVAIVMGNSGGKPAKTTPPDKTPT